ncbi:hypothetical protein MNBD_BACTEROID01-1266 [hydrothermal vent metagenome]|uniref:Uncharacterized protein n=1 Tax=hydrothermal vent metagenome TaxID=652676 RepID=A0A3B0TH43_9ZZZZ
MKTKVLLALVAGLLFFNPSKIMAQPGNNEGSPGKLVVLWTSGDPYVAERVALMYTHAAKTAHWFSDVTLIIWGPSAKLVAENIKIQEKVQQMQTDGVVIEACVVCANSYGVANDLRKLGFDVKGMGKPLTDYLKSSAKVLTF